MMKNSKKKAQSLIEYGLILALVAIIALTVLGKFGTSVTNVGNNANDQVQAAADNALCNYCNSLTGQDITDCKANLPASANCP